MRTFRYNAHEVAAAFIRPGVSLLDVGCGPGRFAEYALRAGASPFGVDASESALDEYRTLGLEAALVDLNDPSWLAIVNGRTFDQIVTLDVLEHVLEPARLLSDLVKHLPPDGEIIASIPNVTHLDVRVELWSGRFRYADSGLLDRGHIRLFDWPAVEQMITEVGLEICERVDVSRDGRAAAREAGIDQAVLDDLCSNGEPDVQQWVMRLRLKGRDRPLAPAGFFLLQAIEFEAAFAATSAHCAGLEALLAAGESQYSASLDEHASRWATAESALRGRVESLEANLAEEAHNRSALESRLSAAASELAAVRRHPVVNASLALSAKLSKIRPLRSLWRTVRKIRRPRT